MDPSVPLPARPTSVRNLRDCQHARSLPLSIQHRNVVAPGRGPPQNSVGMRAIPSAFVMPTGSGEDLQRHV